MKKTVISTGGAVIQDKKIFLARRPETDKRYGGCWGCPGGRQDPGEELTDTVRREVKEEVGLDFEPAKEFGVYKKDLGDVLLIGHVFLGEASGDVKLDPEEAIDSGWFSYEEAKELPLSFSYPQVIEDLHSKGLI